MPGVLHLCIAESNLLDFAGMSVAPAATAMVPYRQRQAKRARIGPATSEHATDSECTEFLHLTVQHEMAQRTARAASLV